MERERERERENQQGGNGLGWGEDMGQTQIRPKNFQQKDTVCGVLQPCFTSMNSVRSSGKGKEQPQNSRKLTQPGTCADKSPRAQPPASKEFQGPVQVPVVCAHRLSFSLVLSA